MADAKTPRQAIYRSFDGHPGACPRCGGKLVKEYRTYAVATRQGKRLADSFVIGGDFGWLCESCPVIVINQEEIGKMLSFQKAGWSIGSEYLVLGIVDLDAIPASKRHLPIGDPGNPLPLIEFSDIPEDSMSLTSSSRKKRKRHR